MKTTEVYKKTKKERIFCATLITVCFCDELET